MLQSSRGIVISSIKYGDSGFITKIYTQREGLIPFIVQGVYGKKAAIRASMLQAFTLVDAVYYFKKNSEIQRLKELKCSPLLVNIQTDIRRSSVALFCAEVIQKVLKVREPDEQLFHYIHHLVLELESDDQMVSNFPIKFMVEMSKSLGFPPSKGIGTYFYLQEGVFSNIRPADIRLALNEEQTLSLRAVLNGDSIENATQRAELLDKLLLYYEYHVQGFGTLKSLPVLKSMLRPSSR